ncbi:MAG: lipopolysaccharide biosynthesis protein [Tannerella sp.]|jgi:O-antigen/teichoic acid export membrane protein|nr:lipopolysaccharide biosynthesis protein [Tannerella sp.]
MRFQEKQKNIPEPSLKDKTAKGLFWGGMSSGLQQIFQLIFGIVMLSLLDPEDFGIVGLLAIFLAIAVLTQDGGFAIALINRKEIRYEDYNAVFWFNIIISSVLYIILFFSAPLISHFYNTDILTRVARVFFLSFLFIGIGNAHYAYMSKTLMVKEKATIDVISLLVSGITGIIMAYKGFAYWAIVLQSTSYFFISTSMKWFYVSWKPSLNINLKPLKHMFSFSINLYLTNIFSKISENIFSVLLGKFYDTKDIVGYYTQGHKWSVMGGTFVSGMLNSVAMPVFVQINEEKDRQRKAFRKMLRFGALISFPSLLGLFFVGKDFLLIIANGDKWQPATPFLQLFCLWYSVYFIWSLYTNMLLTHKKSNIYMWGTILTAISQLISITILFLLKCSIQQMVIAHIGIYFMSLLFWQYFIHKLIGLKFSHVIRDIAPYLTISIGCILISWFVTKGIENIYVRFTLKIIITAILYITIVWKSNSTIIRESYAFFQRKPTKYTNE